MRAGFVNIKNNNFRINKWRERWVKNIVYKTAANFQTSFWRLKNYANTHT